MKASVLINNYNYQDYVSSCLQSLLDQSYDDIEIIFFDDNSKDQSLEEARRFDDKVQIITNQEAKSKYNSHNQFNAIKKAFEKSQGEIIFLLDSDDYFTSLKIEKILHLYQENVAVQSFQDAITPLEKGVLKKPDSYLTQAKNFNALDYLTSLNLAIGLGPQTSGLSFRRAYFEELLNRYNKEVPLIWPDIQLGRKAIIEGKAKVLKESYTVRRIHTENDSLKLKDNNFMTDFLIQYTRWFNEAFHENVNFNYKNRGKVKMIVQIFSYFIRRGNLYGVYFFLRTFLGNLK